MITDNTLAGDGTIGTPLTLVGASQADQRNAFGLGTGDSPTFTDVIALAGMFTNDLTVDDQFSALEASVGQLIVAGNLFTAPGLALASAANVADQLTALGAGAGGVSVFQAATAADARAALALGAADYPTFAGLEAQFLTNVSTVVIQSTGSGANVIVSAADGAVRLGISTNEIGFYGTAGVAQQTVAVTASDIHAALVALGLFAP